MTADSKKNEKITDLATFRKIKSTYELIRIPDDKSCWTCKYLGNWIGDTFIQDFTCTWFPKHGKGEKKKLWPQKDPDEGCKFWEDRKGSN